LPVSKEPLVSLMCMGPLKRIPEWQTAQEDLVMKLKGLALIVSMLLVFRAAAGPKPPTGIVDASEGQAASAQANGQASAQAQSGQTNAGVAGGTAMKAELNSPVDSKKAKPGDPVTAHTTEPVKSDGKTVIPKGAKLVGHVTQASARGKGDAESALGVAFDKAILKNGQEVPLQATIQAMAAAQSSAAIAGSDIDTIGSAGGSAAGSGAAGGRGALGGVAGAAGGAVGSVTNTAANAGSVAGTAGSTVGGAANSAAGVAGSSRGAIGGLNAAGQLTSNSQGVFGLNGLNLVTSSASDTQGSVITSTGKNVHLDSGTRMLLVTQSEAGKQGEGKKPEGGKPGREPKSEERKPEKQ